MWQYGQLIDRQWRLLSVLVQCCCIQHGLQRTQYNKRPRGTSFENIQLSRWWRQRRRTSWSFIEQARFKNNVLLMLWIFERCWLFLRFKINVEDLGPIHDDSNTPILGDVAERRFHMFLIDDTVPLSVCPLCSRIVVLNRHHFFCNNNNPVSLLDQAILNFGLHLSTSSSPKWPAPKTVIFMLNLQKVFWMLLAKLWKVIVDGYWFRNNRDPYCQSTCLSFSSVCFSVRSSFKMFLLEQFLSEWGDILTQCYRMLYV